MMDVRNRTFPSKRHPNFGRGRYFSQDGNSGQNRFNNWRGKREEQYEESSDVKPAPQKPVKKQNYGPKHKEHTGGIKEWRLVVRNLDDYVSFYKHFICFLPFELFHTTRFRQREKNSKSYFRNMES